MSQDYNATINLPKTDFPMRAGLPKREPGMLENFLEKEYLRKTHGKKRRPAAFHSP
jgi:isoleucyl-tRNA synthetase